MNRLFCKHIKREVTSLDGAWRYAACSEDNGEADFSKGLKNAKTVIIPSVWNTEKDLLEYEGAVWYERDFYTEGGTLRFSFGAVMTKATVYLDGELLGEHYGGFCKFHFTKTNVSKGIHRLTVKADNRFDKYSIPHAVVDWYHYGGITRSVEVERLKGITVLYSLLDYTLEENQAECKLRLELYNAKNEKLCDNISVALDGKNVYASKVSLEAYESRTLEVAFSFDNAERWSPDSPRLYTLLTETSSDDLYERVGFRKVEVKEKDILINGKKTVILGVNRHEDHPDFGMAFPASLMGRDLDIIGGMGCNSIRGSHYPNAPIFIDMLDERGMLFWSEIPMWGPGYSEELFRDGDFVKRATDMHREMILEYYNHPSIIIWGIFNETDTTTEAAKEFTKTCYDLLKNEGGNRLVTYATNKLTRDVCLEYCDFISLNVYVGWYEYNEEGFDSWENALETLETYFEKAGVSEKPIVMSEFGAAAIYGHHTFDNLKWTEEYQSELIESCLRLFLVKKGYTGAYIWQFSDIRTAKEAGINRARSYNNKGLLNEYRRPKLAYRTVKNFFETFKKENNM